MSADNGIYILVTKDQYKLEKYIAADGDEFESYLNMFDEPITAYRVAHVQAIDNFDWIRDTQLYMLGKYMHDVWGKSPVFYDKEAARDYAQALHREIGWTEYGIGTVGAEEFSFT